MGHATDGAKILIKGFRATAKLADTCHCDNCGERTSRKAGWPTARGTVCMPCKKTIRQIDKG